MPTHYNKKGNIPGPTKWQSEEDKAVLDKENIWIDSLREGTVDVGNQILDALKYGGAVKGGIKLPKIPKLPPSQHKTINITPKKRNVNHESIIDGVLNRTTPRPITQGQGRYDPKVYIPANELIGTQKGDPLQSVNPDQMKLFDLPTDPAGKEALRIFSENIAIKSGYQSMADFRKNVMNKWPSKDQDQLFRQLWEGQGEGYIEHLTAKGSHMDWYWNMKGADRNAVNNVRILYNDNLKNLKDTVEKIVYGTPQNPGLGWQGATLENRLIVSFEDPMRKVKKDYLKQNPGDIIIKRAGNDQIIGNLGQYLDTLYPQDPLLKKVFEEGVEKLGLTPAQFRRQVLSERIGIIIENSDTLPKNATKRKRYIKQFIDDDMTDLVAQYPFLSPRKSISKAMDSPGSGVTEADYDLRSTKRASKVPPLGDPRFTKGGPFKDVTKTEQFNPRQILLDIFGPDNPDRD